MKPILDKDFLKRISKAASNGSKVASIILDELKDCEDTSEIFIAGCKANFFNSKRRLSSSGSDSYKVMDVVVTYCNKDVNNEHFPDRGNPNAPYYSENRSECRICNFAKLFKKVVELENSGELKVSDFDYLDSAFRVCSSLTVSISDDICDFESAYNESNYFQYSDSEQSCLHGSCMRHEDRARNASDFYANFCGAMIMSVRDEEGSVLGRAIVWPKVDFTIGGRVINMSVIDRMYFSFKFVYHLMINKASENGITVRKTENTYSSKNKFTVISENEYEFSPGVGFTAPAEIKMNPSVFHKKGCPYMDTFSWLIYKDSHLYICNTEDEDALGSLTSTDGFGTRYKYVCPISGQISENMIHDDERVKLVRKTYIGNQLSCGWKEYNGTLFPDICFDDSGNPSHHLMAAYASVKVFR